MRQSGELVEWNDDRGFGFIRAGGNERLFVHISSIRRIATRPRIGDRLSFARGKGRNGRPAAIDVEIAGANPLLRTTRDPARSEDNPHERWSAGLVVRLVAGVLILALALVALSVGRAPDWLLWLYVGVGALSFANYWADKRAAIDNRWRTAEAKLHGLDLVGGIVGGLFAQVALRHKTSKPRFALASAGIALLHCCALAALILRFYYLEG